MGVEQQLIGATSSAPPRYLHESSNLAAFERATKARIAAYGDQCVGRAALCRPDVGNRQIRYKADAGGCLEGTALWSRDHDFIGLPAQFIIDAGKHLQGPSDVQHLAVWECQHQDALGLSHSCRLTPSTDVPQVNVRSFSARARKTGAATL